MPNAAIRWHVPIQIKLTSFIIVAARKRKRVEHSGALYIAIICISKTTHFIIASLPFTRQLHTVLYCEKLARLWNYKLKHFFFWFCIGVSDAMMLKVSVKTILRYVMPCVSWLAIEGDDYEGCRWYNGIVKSLATSEKPNLRHWKIG